MLRPCLFCISLTALVALLPLAPPAQAAAPVPLAFTEFFVPPPAPLQLTSKIEALNGKRVKLQGYMVKMENPMAGAFYLTQHPTFCDEEGAGTADLPPACVLVIVRGAKNRTLGFVGRPLIVTGVLQVGAQTVADDQISHFRLILDGPEPAMPTPPKQAHKTSAKMLTKKNASEKVSGKDSRRHTNEIPKLLRPVHWRTGCTHRGRSRGSHSLGDTARQGPVFDRPAL